MRVLLRLVVTLLLVIPLCLALALFLIIATVRGVATSPDSRSPDSREDGSLARLAGGSADSLSTGSLRGRTQEEVRAPRELLVEPPSFG